MPKTSFTQADVTRAIDALRKRDLPVMGLEVEPDGTFRLLTTVDKAQKGGQGDEPRKWVAAE